VATKHPFEAKYDGTSLTRDHRIRVGHLVYGAADGSGYYHADKTECPFYKECKPIYD
jgi:hypothetical protein